MEDVFKNARQWAENLVALVAGGHYESLSADLDSAVLSVLLGNPSISEANAPEMGTYHLIENITADYSADGFDVE
jgi:hypothetical protein